MSVALWIIFRKKPPRIPTKPGSIFNLNCSWEVFKRHYKYKAKGIHKQREEKVVMIKVRGEESEKKNKVKERIFCYEKEKVLLWYEEMNLVMVC